MDSDSERKATIKQHAQPQRLDDDDVDGASTHLSKCRRLHPPAEMAAPSGVHAPHLQGSGSGEARGIVAIIGIRNICNRLQEYLIKMVEPEQGLSQVEDRRHICVWLSASRIEKLPTYEAAKQIWDSGRWRFWRVTVDHSAQAAKHVENALALLRKRGKIEACTREGNLFYVAMTVGTDLEATIADLGQLGKSLVYTAWEHCDESTVNQAVQRGADAGDRRPHPVPAPPAPAPPAARPPPSLRSMLDPMAAVDNSFPVATLLTLDPTTVATAVSRPASPTMEEAERFVVDVLKLQDEGGDGDHGEGKDAAQHDGGDGSAIRMSLSTGALRDEHHDSNALRALRETIGLTLPPLAADLLAPLRTHMASDGFLASPTLLGINNVHLEPSAHAMPGTPLYEAFIAACRSLPGGSIQLVFHGTADENVTPILTGGLDPSRRGANGQAHGPGEYFSTIAYQSAGYCRPSRLARRAPLGGISDQVAGAINDGGASAMSKAVAPARAPEEVPCARARMLVFAVLLEQPHHERAREAQQRYKDAQGARVAPGSSLAAAMRRAHAPMVVVVERSERQLPLATLHFDAKIGSAVKAQMLTRSGHPITTASMPALMPWRMAGGQLPVASAPPHFDSRVVAAQQVEAMRGETVTWEVRQARRQRDEAMDAANKAERQARDARCRARVLQLIIRDDLQGASDMYAKMCAPGGLPPPWAADVAALLPLALDPNVADALFPGARSLLLANGKESSQTMAVEELDRRARALRSVASKMFENVLAAELKARDVKQRAPIKPLEPPKDTMQAAAAWRSHWVPAAMPTVPTAAAAPLALPASAAAPAHHPMGPPAPTPTPGATRRLCRELRPLLDGSLPHVRVTLPSEGDCYTWQVEMTIAPHTPDGDDALNSATVLAEQLRRHAAAHGGPAAVTIALHFSGDYPAAPPFVRVVQPRLAFHTGHVTVGGSICMRELTSTGWAPNDSVALLLERVHAALLAGKAALDPLRAHVPYTYAEARAAFVRVAHQHGWQP